jgi:GT2 family glycosyltransferase
MSGPSRRRPHQRQLIHHLNQRYYEQWRRAEQLERELREARLRWVGPLIAALRGLRRRLWPARPDPAARVEVPPCQFLEEVQAAPAGRVSIVIPFRDQPELLRRCLRGLRETDYADREWVLVNHDSRDPRTLRYLERLARRPATRVVERSGPFNFSTLCNAGAAEATGDYLLFLNNDTEVLHPDWLRRMLRVAARADVGAVGATLLYADGTLQHAGMYPGPRQRWVHVYRGMPADHAGQRGELPYVRAVPAVTGACLLVRRDLFAAVGGFDERFPLTYGDVDLCQRLQRRGLHVAVTPHARLLHHEGLSRGFSGDRPGTEHLSALDQFPTSAPGGGR